MSYSQLIGSSAVCFVVLHPTKRKRTDELNIQQDYSVVHGEGWDLLHFVFFLPTNSLERCISFTKHPSSTILRFASQSYAC